MSEPTGTQGGQRIPYTPNDVEAISDQLNDVEFSPQYESQITQKMKNLAKRWSGSRWADDLIPMTPDEMSGREEQTWIRIQKSLLPSLKKHLENLLTSFGLNDTAPKNSKPCLHDSLEILSQFGPTMDHLKSAIISLAPRELPHGQIPTGFDANDAALNQIRWDHLEQDFDQLIYDIDPHHLVYNDIHGLFLEGYVWYIQNGQLNPDHPSHFEDKPRGKPTLKDHIVRRTALLCRQIDDMIENSARSDFGLIQADWKRQVNHIGEILTPLAAPIKSLKTPPSNRADRPERIPVLNFFERLVTIIKLIRIFLNKLLSDPQNRITPTTFSDRWICGEIARLQRQLMSIREPVEWLEDRISGIGGCNRICFRTLDQLEMGGSHVIRECFEKGSILLADLIIPAGSSDNIPPPKTVLDSVFSDFVPQFNRARQNLEDSLVAVSHFFEAD
ncbi:hypothetical protein PCANC_07043 [Puccinia coronata f. sp. avenae]|uniref:Uncharacterized protein n=1 Tax=Puccinia coronata f. sp. avenae TaxID=200324 RepID=A0A2N5VZN3_9BASI|nr:hypothetical protein PCANC_07043 [Puccinia coronata f. sp. avenae]